MSDISELLKKSSQEVKRERHIETVSINEIFHILHLFPISENEIGSEYKQIGLSQRSFNDDKAKGRARLVTKYALLGLLHEQNQQSTHEFTYDELSIILAALINHIKTRSEPHQQEVANIQKIIMQLMLEKM